MKIHIYYRHTSNNVANPFRPQWFSYEKCFENLLKTIEGYDNIHLTLAMDGENVLDFTHKYKDKYTLFQTHNNSSLKSFKDLIEYVKEQPMESNDLIYWLENDYMHVDGWVDKLTTLFKTYSGLDYVSLYDHNDKYIAAEYEDLVSKIIVTENHHWRTTPSTCGSYIITRKTFEEDYDIWSVAVGDHNTFIYINESRNRFVFSPIPGLSTHCMETLLSPTIKWNKI
jgi:Txe/YoeB family toxin of Txe-Axe toxin-antitoxin module